MVRRPTEARLMKALGRRFSGHLPDMTDYTSRLTPRYKEWRLARLLSGWPAFIEETAEALPVLHEPLPAYRRAA